MTVKPADINLAKSPFVACDQKTAVMTQYQKTYQNIIGEGGCCEVDGVKTNKVLTREEKSEKKGSLIFRYFVTDFMQ